jgi:aspartate aminotransferase
MLSDRINNLAESQTIGMAKKARELAAKGISVINLSFGEPDFQTPQHIKDAAKKAMDDGYTFYTPVSGYLDLRQAIADKLKRDNNLEYKAENIVVSTGAKQSIANAVLCLVNPGDEVIIPTPYWVSYSEIIKLAEAKAVYVRGTIDKDFKITPQQLRDAITPKTKMFIYSSPCNPTGSVYTAEELQALADVFKDYPNILVIADEIYEYINFTGKHASMASIDFMKPRTVTVNGVSKGFAMTGWRIGYIAAEKIIADACDKMQGQFTSGTCSIAQKATLAAYQGSLDTAIEMSNAYLRRRDLVLGLMKEIPGLKTNTPQGAFYIFPDVTYYFGKSTGDIKINTAEDLCMYLLNDAHVSLVTGEAFGDPDCIRFSYAASDDNLKIAMERIKVSLAKLS